MLTVPETPLEDFSPEFSVRRKASPRAASEWRFVIVEGPDEGKTFRVRAHPARCFLIGASPLCELQLNDPTASRRHAALEISGERLRITDLGSRNGTTIAGNAILDAHLFGGESLRIGRTVLQVERVSDDEEVTSTVRKVSRPSSGRVPFGGVVAASVAMDAVIDRARRLAPSTIPILIEGETGTGKEVLSLAIHTHSMRSGPLVVFDCTTVPPQLLESELFGHEKGAFTGATATRVGLFEEADGGTLLIDEIGELDFALQGKLLRAIAEGEFRRVGASVSRKANVRVLGATRRNIDEEVAEGRFRQDLFHRLAVGRIELPPLRARSGDISLLANHFAKERGYGGELPHHVLQVLEAHNWPGNVRELRSAVEIYLVLGDAALEAPSSTSSVSVRSSTAEIDEWVEAGIPFAVARRKALEAFEQRYVQKVLDSHGGNVTQAARSSGIALRYFRLLKARHRPR